MEGLFYKIKEYSEKSEKGIDEIMNEIGDKISGAERATYTETDIDYRFALDGTPLKEPVHPILDGDNKDRCGLAVLERYPRGI